MLTVISEHLVIMVSSVLRGEPDIGSHPEGHFPLVPLLVIGDSRKESVQNCCHAPVKLYLNNHIKALNKGVNNVNLNVQLWMNVWVCR